MTNEQYDKVIILHREKERLCNILNEIEDKRYKLCFVQAYEDSMFTRDIKELHTILDIHHVSIIDAIKKRIEVIKKEIELL